MLKIYHYPGCSTCKKALKYLDANRMTYKAIDVSETAPTTGELRKMLSFHDGEIRRLFNTSGKLYRELELSKKIRDMSHAEAIALLADNGMLVKRPFVLSNNAGLVGFKEEDWSVLL